MILVRLEPGRAKSLNPTPSLLVGPHDFFSSTPPNAAHAGFLARSHGRPACDGSLNDLNEIILAAEQGQPPCKGLLNEFSKIGIASEQGQPNLDIVPKY
jgi:hypothetical protein